MAEPGKDLASPLPAVSAMAFEVALQKLQAIVEAMESDELPLETLLARYEEGTRLAQICQAKLAEAELKIQALEKSSSGETVRRPFSLNANSESNL